MRQRISIILTIVVIIGLLVVLNTLTYVKTDKTRDTELAPNRSTYHSGPTGTRAIYDLLSESGYKVIRWREAPDRLLSEAGQKVTTFVVIGGTQVPFTEEDASALFAWIQKGGRLVLIDRSPEPFLLPQTGDWVLSHTESPFPGLDDDPGDPKKMTESVTALQPQQPTVLTQEIQAVMPSRFASHISIAQKATGDATEEDDDLFPDEPNTIVAQLRSPAPVVHIADGNGALLIDYSYGSGHITWLSDPYIVANGGIGLKDNLQLAINAMAGYEGLVAFDEYHQGKGVTQNAFASYFAGTPVLAIGAQIVVLVLLILWTNGRRFGRPLPLPQVDRRSSLEFVASMSELQERAKAFDLAIENIYSRTRRVLARHAGVDYNSPRSEIASRVASRSTIDAHQLETLMRQCEEAINGAPITWRQSIDLVRRLREIERSLGLRMRSRDARQAAEKIEA